MIRILALLFLLLPAVASAQQTVFVPICVGTNDTARVTAIVTGAAGNPRTIRIPHKASANRCALNTLTFPSNIALDFTDGSINRLAGQTITIQGPIIAPAKQIFFGTGTVSFSGNKTLRSVFPEWWGAGDGIAAATNASAFNAASAALVTNSTAFPSGEIVFGPGTYSFNSTFTVGSDAAFSGISLRGTNGYIGTVLSWTGSTSATAIRVTRGRANHISDLVINNLSAKGTTVGLLFTGPAGGTQTAAMMMERAYVSNFHIGVQMGESGGLGISASEMTVINSQFISNNIGFQTYSQNTLNLNFYNCGFDSNATYGLNLEGTCNMNFYGGTFGRNGIGFRLYDAYYFISGIRDEVSFPDYRFIVASGGSFNTQLTVTSCQIATDIVLTRPMIITAGGSVTLLNNTFAYGTNHSIIPYGDSDDGFRIRGSATSLTMIGNTVDSVSKLFHFSNVDAQADGFNYHLQGNIKLVDGGTSLEHWPDEDGHVVYSAGVGIFRVPEKLIPVAHTSAAIQAVIDQLSVLGGTIQLLAGPYTLSTTITVTERSGVRIIGAGAGGGVGGSGGTVLLWAGNSTLPALRIWGSHDCFFEGFMIKSSSAAPLAVGIRSETKTGGFYTGHNTFRDVQIYSSDANGLAIGWQWTAGSGGDANNDENSLYDCYAFRYHDAGYDVTHAQSVGHKFYGGGLNSYRTGAASIGLRTVQGNYLNIYGWSGGGNTSTDFLSQGAAMAVYGFHSEHSQRLLDNGPVDAFGGSVSFKDVTFIYGPGELPADKRIIRSVVYGNMTLENVTFDGADAGAPGADPVEIHFLPGATYRGQHSLTINGLSISTSLPFPTMFTGVLPDNATGIQRIYSDLGATRSVTLSLLAQHEGAVLTIGSNTIAPTNSIHQVGAGLIKTITVPSGFTSGTIMLVPTAAFTYDATGNILGTGTAVVGRTMHATYSSTTSKWSMSY